MSVPQEVAECLSELERLKAEVKERTNAMRELRDRLIEIAVAGFNEISEPIDGIVADNDEVVVGYKPCTASPITVCVYGVGVISIPGQRDLAAGLETEATSADACLFCGRTPEDSKPPV